MRTKAFTAGVFFALATSPVFAADLPPAAPPPPRAPAAYIPVAAPLFNWTGFYVGANGGYDWANWNDGLGDTFKSAGWLAGGQIGFNYQINQFVIGVEGDIDWSGVKWSQSAATTFLVLGVPGTLSGTISNKDDVLSTLAARFGYAADRALFYGKAGGAWTQEVWNTSITSSASGTASGTNTFNRFGWMVGAGVEYAVTDMITLKGEYNYIDFGSNNETLSITTPAAGTFSVAESSKLNMNVVKVGVNFLFH